MSRRRRRRERAVLALAVLIFFSLLAIIYELWQPALRISSIEIYNGDPLLAALASTSMQGAYLGVVPRNSSFFLPEGAIRRSILAFDPSIAAVSIFRHGFTDIGIKISERVAVARWCGLAPTPGVQEYCYVFDANGFIFASAASTKSTINGAALYAPLVSSTTEPLRATLSSAEQLPQIFDFARQTSALGSATDRIVIARDEVTLYEKSGTRIVYLLGDEQNAYTALVSARDNFNLADGSVEYIDLRFLPKVYVKKTRKSPGQQVARGFRWV